MLAKTTHIVAVNGEWTVKREGCTRAAGVYSTKKKPLRRLTTSFGVALQGKSSSTD